MTDSQDGSPPAALAHDAANVACQLAMQARANPDAVAVIDPRRRAPWRFARRGRAAAKQYTYRELDLETNRLARGFLRSGIGPGVRTVLMVPPSLEFFALAFALFKAGAVPVFVDPGIGLRRLKRCLVEARPGAFIGTPKAHAARALLGWARGTLRARIVAGARFTPGMLGLDLVRERGRSAFPLPLEGDDSAPLAAILFTSGSTGPPKGVVYTHAMFNAEIAHLRDSFGIEAGEIDLCTFPLFSLFAVALGLTAVIPDMNPTRPAEVDAARLVETIAAYGVQNLFGSPALLDRLGRHCGDTGTKLESLKRVISAGAPVTASILARMQGALDAGVEIFTPYGATEALPITSIGSREILAETAARTAEGAGVCVGRPLSGNEIAVIDMAEDPEEDDEDVIEEWSDDLRLAPGEIGEICVRGAVVSREYYNRPQSTLLAKIFSPDRERFFHRMGDAGYLDPAGRLWFCGRKSERVKTASGTLYTVPCEGVFNRHPAVKRTALAGVGRGAERVPVLCVELERDGTRPPETTIRRELLELGARHEHTAGIHTILFHRAFPVDARHNAKIQRGALARWARKRTR
ncbi:MAG: AMP-binding protein [Planctomycetes bacterium]|nr:AMP-binding protein [Planctomycetota bacterium]